MKIVLVGYGAMGKVVENNVGEDDRIIAVVAPGVLATCDRNPGVPRWRDPSVGLKERFRSLQDPKGRPLKEQFVYDMRLSNVFVAVAHMLSLCLKVIFPLPGRKK